MYVCVCTYHTCICVHVCMYVRMYYAMLCGGARTHTQTQAGPLQGQYECIIYTVFYFIYHAIMHRLNECNLVIKCSVTGENVG